MLTKRERRILETLCANGDQSEAALRVSNAFMCDNLMWRERPLVHGYFKRPGPPNNKPSGRFWGITEAGCEALRTATE